MSTTMARVLALRAATDARLDFADQVPGVEEILTHVKSAVEDAVEDVDEER